MQAVNPNHFGVLTFSHTHTTAKRKKENSRVFFRFMDWLESRVQ